MIYVKDKLRNIVSDQIWPHINPIWDHVCDCVDKSDSGKSIMNTQPDEAWDAMRRPLCANVEAIQDFIVNVPISLI